MNFFSLQGSKNDWVSGDVAIPKFHCPRCRDHWYGISAYPCDEELARLIREGKWYTGKEGNLTQYDSDTKTRNRKVGSASTKNASYDSTRLPGIRKRRGTGIEINKSDRKTDFIDPRARTGAKKNRKISFKLDGDDSELDNSGSSGLLHDGETRTGRKGNKDDNNGAGRDLNGKKRASTESNGTWNDSDKARTNDSSSSASDINSSSSTTLLKDTSRGFSRAKDHMSSVNEGGDNDSNIESVKGSKNKAQTKGSDASGLESGTNNRGRGQNANDLSGDGSIGRINKRANDTTGGLSDITGSGQPHSSSGTHGDGGVGNGLDKDDNASGRNGGNDNSDRNGQSNDKEGNEAGTSKNGKKNRRGGRSDSLSSSRYGSRSSLHGGSQRWSENGDSSRRGDKELVAGKGYMRASSPSQSEWGDPTHAKAWISNTASSSRVSLTQSRDKEDDRDIEEIYLPPIKNQSRHPFATDEFMDGFNLTRAFTFSYY